MHAVGDRVQGIEQEVRLDLGSEVAQPRLAQLRGQCLRSQLTGPPDLEFADGKQLKTSKPRTG